MLKITLPDYEISLPSLIFEWARKEYSNVGVDSETSLLRIRINPPNIDPINSISAGYDIWIIENRVWYKCRINCLAADNKIELTSHWAELLISDPNFFSNLKRALDRNLKIKKLGLGL